LNYRPESVFSAEQWAEICKLDPTYSQFMATSNWQSSRDVANVYFAENPLAEIIGAAVKDGKGKSANWRELQKKCWELYRGFGPISSAVNSKADYTTGHGFSIYSSNLEIRTWLKDFIYSYRNRLYAALNGWLIRMLAEGELFVLLIFDEEGRATVRLLEPDRIGKGASKDGILTNPNDVTQTLFYEHYYDRQSSELIPDVSILLNPDVMLPIVKDVEGYVESKTERSRGTGGKFKKIGGYNRFILHWKNLTGIHEYKRDMSVISTVLEAVNLYWNAIKWQLDHKKAQCAYTNVIKFSDSPQGRIAYGLWKSLTEAERKATGLEGALSPGSTIFLLPGMEYDVQSPQLSKLEGENQDLLNVAGAGMKSPQDMFQGQSAGATHASLRASRSPLEMEIKNVQYKLHNFLVYEVFRACFHVSSMFGKLAPTFKKEEVEEFREGIPKFAQVDVEPIELVEITFPEISFEGKPEGQASAYLGSKHSGLRSLGISDKKIAEKMGIGDLERQRAQRALEEKQYGVRDAVLNEKQGGSNDDGNNDGNSDNNDNNSDNNQGDTSNDNTDNGNQDDQKDDNSGGKK